MREQSNTLRSVQKRSSYFIFQRVVQYELLSIENVDIREILQIPRGVIDNVAS